ncbi:MAG: DNA alkylation repair protein [Pirellulales bacterium]
MAKKQSTKKAPKPKAASVVRKPASSKPAPQVKEILGQLGALGNARMRAHNAKQGAGDNQFGVKLGDVRALANQIKTNHELALALWATDNVEARLLATLLIKPQALSPAELERMVRSATFVPVADWLHSYVVKEHPGKESLRQRWMTSDDPMAARAGWRLTAGRVAKSAEGLDLVALLHRIEAEMGSAAPVVQWTMNACLAEIGIHFPQHRTRAIAIGEKLGLYRDYPVSKGCTSPFAPTWIIAMVSRQG